MTLSDVLDDPRVEFVSIRVLAEILRRSAVVLEGRLRNQGYEVWDGVIRKTELQRAFDNWAL